MERKHSVKCGAKKRTWGHYCPLERQCSMKNKVVIIINDVELTEPDQSVDYGIGRVNKIYLIKVEGVVSIALPGVLTQSDEMSHVISGDELMKLIGAAMLGGLRNIKTEISFDLIAIKEE